MATQTFFGTANTSGIDFTTTYQVNVTADPSYPGPPLTAGTVVKGSEESEWVLCTAASDLGIGQVLILTNAWVATPVTTTNGVAGFGSLVAVNPLVTVSSGAYFWAQRQGECAAILSIATTTANVQLYASTTAGVVYSTATTGNAAITGIILTTTNATAAATKGGTLNFPVVGALAT